MLGDAAVEVSVTSLVGTAVVALTAGVVAVVYKLMRHEFLVDRKLAEVQKQIDTLDEAVSTLMEVAGVGKERGAR